MRPAPGWTTRVAGLALCLLAGGAQAAIYTCTDAKGRRLTSDRPIPDCLDRSQALRNNDGSVRATLPPSQTAEERAASDEAQRRQAVVDAERRDAVRHDRNLLARYPDIQAHNRARENALDPLRQALKSTDNRLAEMQREQRAIEAEAEFYAGKPVPRKLKARQDDNLTSITAQHGARENHQAEMARINARYDEELVRLRRLWNGAEPGSLGPAPSTAATRAPKDASLSRPPASGAAAR
ncbi:MAG: DUF4124 domain-containing protein [Leptothrix sp. (in: b-proteobacteria)]